MSLINYPKKKKSLFALVSLEFVQIVKPCILFLIYFPLSPFINKVIDHKIFVKSNLGCPVYLCDGVGGIDY